MDAVQHKTCTNIYKVNKIIATNQYTKRVQFKWIAPSLFFHTHLFYSFIQHARYSIDYQRLGHTSVERGGHLCGVSGTQVWNKSHTSVDETACKHHIPTINFTLLHFTLPTIILKLKVYISPPITYYDNLCFILRKLTLHTDETHVSLAWNKRFKRMKQPFLT